jgi:hypothetical protein
LPFRNPIISCISMLLDCYRVALRLASEFIYTITRQHFALACPWFAACVQFVTTSPSFCCSQLSVFPTSCLFAESCLNRED